MQAEIRDVVYKYYIYPFLNDTGYNIVNTITWALVLGVCIFGVQRMLRHLNIVIDRRFIIGVVCYVLFGSSLRVLEDADMFAPPLDHLFVTPVIYFVVFFVTVISLAVSLRIYHERYHVVFSGVGLFLAAVNICALLWYEGITNPAEASLIMALTALITAAIYLSARRMNIRFLSGRTTVGIDLLNYHGKHVVENYLIGITGTGAVMYPLKLLVFIPILYLIGSDFDDAELRDLLKLTILVLGLSPACRNTLSILFGV